MPLKRTPPGPPDHKPSGSSLKIIGDVNTIEPSTKNTITRGKKKREEEAGVLLSDMKNMFTAWQIQQDINLKYCKQPSRI